MTLVNCTGAHSDDTTMYDILFGKANAVCVGEVTTFYEVGSCISLMLRSLKFIAILSALNVAIGPAFVIM